MTPYQYRMLKEKMSGLFKAWHYVKSFVKDFALIVITMFYVGLLLYLPVLIFKFFEITC